MTRPLVPITTVRSGSRTLLDMPGASFSSLSSFGEFFIEKTIGLRQGIGRWREIFVHSGNTNKHSKYNCYSPLSGLYLLSFYGQRARSYCSFSGQYFINFSF
jgi:hypothetical protein